MTDFLRGKRRWCQRSEGETSLAPTLDIKTSRLFDREPLLLVLGELVVQRAAADAELGGGGGAVAVVALQRDEDVLALDFVERSWGYDILIIVSHVIKTPDIVVVTPL